MAADIAYVAIGRNEGERLIACLASLPGRIVYVDSGSTDGSVAAAEAAGATVVQLDMSRPFTAARARNAGAAALDPAPDYIQFIDGDCEMNPDWPEAARAFLDAHPDYAVVAGRLRERFPEASIYNRICDEEWATPPGDVRACGGIAMMRAEAFFAAGGFREDLIAGEEPELCVRLRAAGGKIRRLADEMALHDAAMTRFSQWWRRRRRAGFAFADGARLHGAPPERHYAAERRRALLWGAALPGGIIACALVAPWLLVLLLIYPAQVARLARRGGLTRWAWISAAYTVLGKIPEAIGVFESERAARREGGNRTIEYK